MKIDQQTIRKIAHLARLEFDEQDEQEMLQSMSDILDWVDQLREVDTKEVEPLTSMSHEVNVLRPDEIKDVLAREKGLAEAPRKDEAFFRVPKVIE
ncbi:MAG: Asp-tRNA(Asn)/Glu-tRNA(Gln) amidotransferase subunit GatC [Cyclobacteriaceae bacterium]